MAVPFDPYEQGGITGRPNSKALLDQLSGGTAGVQVPGMQADTPAVPAAPDPVPASGLGQYANTLGGFNMDKFADPNRSEKYKIGEVMSRFDPKGGVTPEVLAALNALGIADFSGSGDQLTVNNTKNDPRFGRGGTADVVHGLKGQNEDTGWSPWFVDDQGGQGATPQGMMLPTVGPGIDPQLSGDPMAAIQAALAQYSGQTPNIQALLKQLQG